MKLIYILFAILFVSCASSENELKETVPEEKHTIEKVTPTENLEESAEKKKTKQEEEPKKTLSNKVPEKTEVKKEVTAQLKKVDTPSQKKEKTEIKTPSKPETSKEVAKAEIVKPKEKVKPSLKLNGYKQLFPYSKSSDKYNYIYANKLTNIEADGRKLLKIKLASSDAYVSLPITRKLKSGKVIVSGIVTLNGVTSKLEFIIVSSKKSVDFALSPSRL